MSELEAIVQLASELTTIGVLLLWLRAERNDNHDLWSIIESLVKLRLRQFEDNQKDAFMELE